MKKLLFIMLLLSLPVAYSCNKGGDEVEKRTEEKTKEDTNKNDSTPSEILGTPVYVRTIWMNNGTAVDTLYFNKGKYVTTFYYLEIFDSALRYPPFFRTDFIEKENVEIVYNDSVVGQVRFENSNLKSIEMYNWFTISEIRIDNKRAYEVRSTGSNPNRFFASLGVYDETLSGETGFSIK